MVIDLGWARLGLALLPTQVANLLFWGDADDASTITESSGSVSQWDDKGPIGNDVSQGTGSLQPTTGVNTINGRNTITWDGAQLRHLNFAGALTAVDLTIIVVHRKVSGDFFSYFASSTDNAQKIQNRGADKYGRQISGAAIDIVDQANEVEIFTLTASDADDELQHSLDGALLSTTAYAQGTKSLMDRIGTEFNSAVSKGDIGEIMIYDRVLTQAEITGLLARLIPRWGI